MATASIKKGKGLYPYQQPPPHFFKVVVQPLDQGIKIPAAFIRRHGDSLEKGVVLKVPGGDEWQVESHNINGETWLEKGWQEFGEFYSIKKYHFLVFRYEGNSRFHVTIFDTTASEIDYPVKSAHQCKHEEVNRMRMKYEDSDDGDNGSIEILEHKRGNKRYSVDEIEIVGKQNLGLSYTIVNGRRLRKRIKFKDGSCEGTSRAPPQSSKRCSNLSEKEKLTACLRDFQSKYPSFACLVRPCYIVPPYCVCIPIAFARDNFPRNYKVGFKVRLAEEESTWPVRLCINARQGRICGDGWKRFAQEKGLTVGEVCIFELVKKNCVFNLYRNC